MVVAEDKAEFPLAMEVEKVGTNILDTAGIFRTVAASVVVGGASLLATGFEDLEASALDSAGIFATAAAKVIVGVFSPAVDEEDLETAFEEAAEITAIVVGAGTTSSLDTENVERTVVDFALAAMFVDVDVSVRDDATSVEIC